jgi:hypothetical protein
MKFQLIICFSLIFHLNAIKNKTQIKLSGSYSHKNHKLAEIGLLDEETNLTLTIVTGSLNNSQLVADYYSSYGKNLTIYEQTKIHVKLSGKVSFLSQIFNTKFIEYKCDNHTETKGAQRKRQKCYASNSEVSIPETLKSAIIGIMGLEQVLFMKPNTVSNKSNDKSNSKSMPKLKKILFYIIFLIFDLGWLFFITQCLKQCHSLNQNQNHNQNHMIESRYYGFFTTSF